jgi:hypothetical protein
MPIDDYKFTQRFLGIRKVKLGTGGFQRDRDFFREVFFRRPEKTQAKQPNQNCTTEH